MHGDLSVADSTNHSQPTAHQLPRRARLALVIAERVDDDPRAFLETQIPYVLAADRRAVHVRQHKATVVRAVAPVILLAAHHSGLAGLHPQFWRL